MLSETLVERLTHRITSGQDGVTYTVVRPGLGLAMYYAKPLHQMVDAIDNIIDAYFRFIPEGAITALCGTEAWGSFTKARLVRQIKQLRSSKVDYTNIDMSSGPLLGSEGPYGWHLNGGNLSNNKVRPNNTNVCFHEFPHDEIDRVGKLQMIDWVVHVAEIHSFESAQFGYSFNQLQRTWTEQADEFVGQVAMRFRGFDILEPALARVCRGHVPNCSWLTLLGNDIVKRLGGSAGIRSQTSAGVKVQTISNGLLIIAGDEPPIGDMNRQGADLGPVREVARLTKPLRINKDVLLYGTEEFQDGWHNRFDE